MMLSLLTGFAESIALPQDGVVFRLNYGLDRVRIIAPVPVDSRVRARFRSRELESRGPNAAVMTMAAVIEVEGSDAPALVADWLGYLQLGDTAQPPHTITAPSATPPLLSDHLDRQAEAQPKQDFLVLGETRLSYAETKQQVDQIARGFIGAGVKVGDRIGTTLTVVSSSPGSQQGLLTPAGLGIASGSSVRVANAISLDTIKLRAGSATSWTAERTDTQMRPLQIRAGSCGSCQAMPA